MADNKKSGGVKNERVSVTNSISGASKMKPSIAGARKIKPKIKKADQTKDE